METSKPKVRLLSTAGFKLTEPQLKWSSVQRAAHFFDWGAQKYPYRHWPWNLMYKAITGHGRIMQPDSTEVRAMRERSAAVRKVLRERYGRDLRTLYSVGASAARATVDDEDMLQESMTHAVRRLDSARRNVLQVNDLIDPKRVRDKRLQEYLAKSVAGIVRTLNAPEFIARLAVPERQALPEASNSDANRKADRK